LAERLYWAVVVARRRGWRRERDGRGKREGCGDREVGESRRAGEGVVTGVFGGTALGA